MTTTFTDFKLNSDIIKGLNAQGITAPTPIQSLTLPAFLEGKDIVAESHTGSGKTLSFVLPLFERIDSSKREMQAIILAPTHELVMQIHHQIALLAKNSGIPITSEPIMGEINIEKQIKKLREKPHIIVGSAGRVLDLMMKKKITAHTIRTIVLDEADNLLDQNQAGTIKKLIYLTPKESQLCIFSASISGQTLETAKELMDEPTLLKTAPKTTLNPNIKHLYMVAPKRDKFEVLRKLLVATHTKKAIIFVSQNTDVPTLIEKLEHHQQTVAAISGKISKEDRKHALTRFKSGKAKLLISSDLSARGLDVTEVSHIFHFDLPLTEKDYLHRAGRTARGTQSGTSICITAPSELGAIRVYEREFGIKFLPIDTIDGKIKSLKGEEISEAMSAPDASSKKGKTAEPKNRNKYPKGFNSDKKKVAPPTPSAPSKKQGKKTIPATKIKKEVPAFSGNFADALDLVKGAKFGKNNE